MAQPNLYRRLSPWLRKLAPYIFALIVLDIFWLHNWTHSGPTWFAMGEMNPSQRRILPALLRASSADSDWLWLLQLKFPANPEDYFAIGLPAIVILLLSLALRHIPCDNRTRPVLKTILLGLGCRYFLWRTLATVNNVTHPVSTVFSDGLWGVELISFISFGLYTVQTMFTTTEKRRNEADQYGQVARESQYYPAVDVLVPTHNESVDIVRRTVMGCQAMDYPNKQIYILDDGKLDNGKPERDGIQQLAAELGCHYIAHPENQHRKAGNLNHALPLTHGELITVMDADFVPFTNFLTRTVGFFNHHRHDIDMVQTPQNFYNPDYHAHNLGLADFLPNDMEHFYGLLQASRDRHNSVICCGSSYVVKRQSLVAIGGYYTGCYVEDFQTSLKLLTQKAKKGQVIYLNETLSMGESTRTFVTFINQRLRWLQANIQVYFRGDDLPIWSKLNWQQQSFMVALGLYCIQPIIRAVFLIAPLVSIYFGIAPVLAPLEEVVYYFLPFWLLLVAVYGWASDYRVNYFWNECYETIFCFPALNHLREMATKGVFFTGSAPTVTAKGAGITRQSNHWELVFPLFLLLIATGVTLGLRYIGLFQGWWPHLNDHTPPLLFWLGYNVVIMLIAVFAADDQLESRTSDRFPLQTPCTISGPKQHYPAQTVNVSEGGALLTIAAANFAAGEAIQLQFPQENFAAWAIVNRHGAHQAQLAVQFIKMTTAQHRRIVELLYTEPDRPWWRPKRPGLTDSVLAIFAALLRL